MNQQEFHNHMSKKRPFLEIVLSPNEAMMKEVRKQYEFITMTDDIYEDRDLWDKLYLEACTVTRLENISLNEAEVIAEPIRIDNPDQNVSITDRAGNYHGHTTWNDQMKMFFEYPTFTQRGLALATVRQIEAGDQGIIASWE
jgi:hypothetical protein